MNIEYEPYYLQIKMSQKYESKQKGVNRFGDILDGIYLMIKNTSSDFSFGSFQGRTLGNGWAILEFHPSAECDNSLQKAISHLEMLGLEAKEVDPERIIRPD
jgi:hypothetical protein